MARKPNKNKWEAEPSTADRLKIAERAKISGRGTGEERTFTVRDKDGHRIHPVSREKVPRGYDLATANLPDDEIVPFKPKLNPRTGATG